MGKKSDPPPAPDFTAAAEKQGENALQNTQLQTTANRPDIYTPWGSQTWDAQAGIDPATGKTVNNWTSNITLSPQQQEALDSQMAVQTGRSNAAQDMLGRAVQGFQPSLDYSGLPSAAGNLDPNADGGWRQKAQDAVSALQRPDLERRHAALDQQLANQGITRGSEAYTSAMRDMGDTESRANLMAIGEGRNEADSSFSRALQSGQFNNQNRQQALAEMLMKRNQPLNELNALLTGQQVGMPQMPGFSNATKGDTTQYLPAAQAQYGASLDAYNASQMGSASATSGLFSLGSAALGSGGWGGLFKF